MFAARLCCFCAGLSAWCLLLDYLDYLTRGVEYGVCAVRLGDGLLASNLPGLRVVGTGLFGGRGWGLR